MAFQWPYNTLWLGQLCTQRNNALETENRLESRVCPCFFRPSVPPSLSLRHKSDNVHPREAGLPCSFCSSLRGHTRRQLSGCSYVRSNKGSCTPGGKNPRRGGGNQTLLPINQPHLLRHRPQMSRSNIPPPDCVRFGGAKTSWAISLHHHPGP